MGNFRSAIQSAHSEAVAMRRDLHRNPELGYQEVRTSGVVTRNLAAFEIDLCPNLAGGTGVLAYLPATANSETARTIALRADMDALPIHEESGVEHSSNHAGIMHACGHDGHTSILVATARALSQAPERPNNVLFVFQPAEEGGAGGHRMCREGALKGQILGRPADVIYGLHGNPWVELGHVTTRVGPSLASASEFMVKVHGKGSHAAYPHLGIDPVLVASQIVVALQTVASRSVGPLESVVVTIGKLVAGTAHNVIPDSALLHGTLRTLKDETYELASKRIREICENVAKAFGATAEVDFVGSYPVTFNHEAPTQRFREVASETLGNEFVHEEAQPSMGAEDFSFYGREVPACFFFLGLHKAGDPPVPNLHSPRFDFIDEAMPTGVELFCELAFHG